jgi:hypothetical protein
MGQGYIAAHEPQMRQCANRLSGLCAQSQIRTTLAASRAMRFIVNVILDYRGSSPKCQ